MFDPRNESPISFADAARLPWLKSRRAGKRVNVKTLHRWAAKGKGGVKLEVAKMAGGRFTSESALIRFFEQAENAGTPGPSAAAVTTQRARDIAQASAILEAAGI